MSMILPSERRDIDLILSPSSTLCSLSPALQGFETSTFPRLEIDSIDTSPFSDSFSGFIEAEPTHWQRRAEIANADTSYDIERFTNIKEFDSEWDDEDVDEILVISPKATRKLSTIEEESPRFGNTEMPSIVDFEPLQTRAEGNRPAHLYRKRDTGQIYSFRTFQDCVKPSSEQAILNVIKDLKAPFLPRIYWSFQEEDHFVVVMEYFYRRCLEDLINSEGALESRHAHFYASELVQAVSSLHAAGIVHRDLSPEHIMIDAAGHIVVEGFGSSEILRHPTRARDRDPPFCTTPISGNSTFRAPELVLGWAHDFVVDCWGFGMLLRFMLSGTHLFTGDASHVAWKDIIVQSEIALYPRLEVPAQDLITKCLERNPVVRLNLLGIKKHIYFSTIDWKNVTGKRIRVPHPLDPNVDTKRTLLGSHIDQIVSPAPKPHVHSRKPIYFSISDIVSTPASPAVPAPHSNLEHLPSLPTISRMSSLLDDPPASMEPMPPSDLTVHSAVTLNDSPPNVLELDINSQDRMALFWDRLDSEQASISSMPFDDMNRTPRPRKLRKSRSSIYPEQRFSTLSTSSLQNMLRKKVRPAHASPLPKDAQPRPGLDLPEGVKQVGSGIGFTYNIPVATRSKESICTNVPQACHGMFQGRLPGLGLGLRSTSALAKAKARRTLLSLVVPEMEEGSNSSAFPRDFRGSSWDFVTPLSPDVLTEGSEDAAAACDSPLSEAGPPTPVTLVYEETGVVVVGEGFEESVAQEVKVGDVEMTLRLVVSSRSEE